MEWIAIRKQNNTSGCFYLFLIAGVTPSISKSIDSSTLWEKDGYFAYAQIDKYAWCGSTW